MRWSGRYEQQEASVLGRGRPKWSREYKVNVVYVGLKSADQSNSRVSIRARNGGHDVPEVDVIRRFDRSLANLPGAIQEADRAFVLDNSARQYRLLASIENGSLRFVSKDLPDWAVAVLQKVGFSSL